MSWHRHPSYKYRDVSSSSSSSSSSSESDENFGGVKIVNIQVLEPEDRNNTLNILQPRDRNDSLDVSHLYPGAENREPSPVQALGATSGNDFWLLNTNAATVVIAMGSVAVLIGVVALLWKYLRGSPGRGCTTKTSAPPAPPFDSSTDLDPENSIYRRELSIYTSIQDGEYKDFDVNNNDTVYTISPPVSIRDLDKKEDGDPYVIDELDSPGCSTSPHYKDYSRQQHQQQSIPQSCNEDNVNLDAGCFGGEMMTPVKVQDIIRVFNQHECSTPL